MQYSKQELQEYDNCFQMKFSGGHKGGMDSCPYCAQVYRRYHPVQNQEDICQCCNGQPTDCQTLQCKNVGLCLQCCVQTKG